MGAETFEAYAEGHDPDTAFDTAQHSHGTRGIAAKTSYVIITDFLTDLDEAEELAGRLIEGDDPRIVDASCGRDPGPESRLHRPRRRPDLQRHLLRLRPGRA